MKTMIVVAIMLGITRIYIGLNVMPDAFQWTQAYKDVAHLFMGGLFVAAWTSKGSLEHTLLLWSVFWGLCVLEVAVAVISRL